LEGLDSEPVVKISKIQNFKSLYKEDDKQLVEERETGKKMKKAGYSK